MDWTWFDLRKMTRRRLNKIERLRGIERLYELYELKKRYNEIATQIGLITTGLSGEFVKCHNDIWINGSDEEIEEMERLWMASKSSIW